MLRRLSIPSAVCLLVSLLAASCTYDSPSLKDAYCDQEGAIRPDDGATCTDGFWIAPPENQDANNTADTSQNACDGNSELTNPPGDACGPCGLDKYVCDGTEQTKCEEIIGCPANNIKIEATSGIDNDQATLHATIVAVDNENIPTDHGFCWFMKDGDDNPTDEKCKSLGALTKAAVGTKITLEIDELWQGHKYFAQPYFVTPDKNDEKQRSPEGEFISFAPAPVQLTASKDQSAHVTLRWEKAKDALTYKVLRDGVPLTDIGEGTEDGTAITINDTTATPGTLVFSTQPTASNDSYDHVSLKGSAATASAPATHKYTVIAVYPDAESAPSNEDQGQLKVGDISYRWKASAPGNDAQFDYLTTAAAAPTDYKDTQAPVDGTPRHYHLEASAPGGGTTLSTKITGNRKPVIKPTLTAPSTTAIHTEQATLKATLTQPGTPPTTERGFCHGTTPAPTTCKKAIENMAPGDFTLTIYSLTPGTEYFVRAYATTDRGTTYGSEIKFITVPDAPTNITATQNQHDRVTIAWTKSKGATTYIILRDNAEIGRVDGDKTTYHDMSADKPAKPAAPTNLTASKDKSDHVLLKWTEAITQYGSPKSYSVVAVNSSGESAKSATKSGFTQAEVTGYEVNINDGPNWVSTTSPTQHKHIGAPPPEIKDYTITVPPSNANPGKTTLSVSNAKIVDGQEVNYRVRAVNAIGDGASTSQVPGHREKCSPLNYKWEHSEDELIGYTPIDGETNSSITINNNALKPYYQVQLSSSCTQSKTSPYYYTGQ